MTPSQLRDRPRPAGHRGRHARAAGAGLDPRAVPERGRTGQGAQLLRHDDGHWPPRSASSPAARWCEWSPFGLGWRTVFLAKLPIGIAVMLAAWLLVPETSASRRQTARHRRGGAGLAGAGLPRCCRCRRAASRAGPPGSFVMLATVPVLAAGFLCFEDRLTARGGRPLLDLGLLAIPSFRRGVLVGTLFFFTTALLRAVRHLPAGGPRHRSAVDRARHPALRHRPVRRPAGHRAAARGCARGC